MRVNEDDIHIRSPDGAYLAAIEDPEEWGMGGDLYGTLVITGEYAGYPVRHRFENCSPDFLWSDDSRTLAVPQKDEEKDLRLIIIQVPNCHWQLVRGGFVSLRLESFRNGLIRGRDGGPYLPMKFEVDVTGARFPVFPPD